MTAILSMFSSGFGGTLLALVVAGGGIVFGLFKRQQTKTALAQVDTAKATQAEQADIAASATASASASQQALAAVTDAVASRAATEAAIPAAPAAVAQALSDEGFTK